MEQSRGPGGEILRVEGVGLSLGGRTVLDRVDLSLRAGELAGLIGANGAGKTTLLRVILGLEHPGRGRVLVDGRPLDRRRTTVGYVPQQVVADPDMPLRARDLVGLGLDGQRLGFALPSKRRRSRIDDALRAVDALDLADARVGRLSGGERQRVLVAHALIGQPRLLLLDEPLANLDLRSEREVVSLLADITREQGVAVMLSAHDINPLLSAVDRVVYVAGGRVASGPTDEVIRTDILTALYGHPVDVVHVNGRVLVLAGEA